jgi:hypothetical protein
MVKFPLNIIDTFGVSIRTTRHLIPEYSLEQEVEDARRRHVDRSIRRLSDPS